MNALIGADAATLAGLQIDLLQKMRQGHITLEHLNWFLGLNKGVRDALVAGEDFDQKPAIRARSRSKFSLLADLGVITVPDGYVHETWLDSFGKKNRGRFVYYNDALTDANFSNPSRVLKPGDKLHVRAFRQVVPGTTTSEERMAFLKTQKAVHTGAQGASLVFEQKRDLLPKGFWYSSFDEKKRLWEDAHGDHRVPDVSAYSYGGFDFGLGSFEIDWGDGHAFLCFCDVEESLGA